MNRWEMNHVKRWSNTLLTMAMAGSLLATAALSETVSAASKPITLSFWVLNSFTPSATAPLYQVIKKFERENPSITVNVDPVAANTLQDKYVTAVAGGGGPDVVSFDIGWAGQFIDGHLLANITKEFKPYASHFFAGPVKALSKDGQNYAVPWYTNNLAIYYNQDLFNKVGISGPPKTWNQFYQDAKVLKAHGYDALSVAKDGFGTYFFLSFLYENDGHIYGPNRKKLTVNAPADVAAFKWFTGIYTKLHAMPDSVKSAFSWNAVYAPFIQGTTAMFISGDWAEYSLNAAHLKFHWSIAPMPKGKRYATVAGGYNLGVGANSAHKIAAWKLIRFLTKKGNEWLLESYDRIPARNDVLHSAYANKNAFVHLFVQQAKYAVPEPSDPSWSQVSNLMGNAFDAVIQGTQKPQAALDRVELEGNPIVAQSFSK